MPSENVEALSLSRPVRPTMSRTSSIRWSAIPRRAARLRRLSLALRAPMKVGFSMRAPTLLANRSGCSIGSPSTVPVPLLAAISPRRTLIVVDLPDPFGPTNPTTPPVGISNVKSSTAVRSPNFRVSLSAVMAGIVVLSCWEPDCPGGDGLRVVGFVSFQAGWPAGRLIVIAVPIPIVESAAMVPWWASTMALAIESPRPDPPVCRVRPGSIR